MTTSCEPIIFVAECPNGHMAVFQKERVELSNSLESRTLILSCDRCGPRWKAGLELEQRLRDRLNMERYMAAVPTNLGQISPH
jgi:hypothetical protein